VKHKIIQKQMVMMEREKPQIRETVQAENNYN